MPDAPLVDLDNLDDGNYLRYRAATDEECSAIIRASAARRAWEDGGVQG